MFNILFIKPQGLKVEKGPRHLFHRLFQWLSISKQLVSEAKRPAAAAAKSLQSCPTLCDPIDSSPPGSPVPGILQARTLEWVAISFSNAWKWKVKVKSLSRVWLLATPWTAAYQAPPPMGFSRQEYWSGVPLPSLKRDQQRPLIPRAKLFPEQVGNRNKKLNFTRSFRRKSHKDIVC